MFNRVAKLCLLFAFTLGTAVICGCEANEAEACDDFGATTFSFTQPVVASYAQPVVVQQFAQPAYVQQFAQPVVYQQRVVARQRFVSEPVYVQRQVVRQRVRGGYGGRASLRVGW